MLYWQYNLNIKNNQVGGDSFFCMEQQLFLFLKKPKIQRVIYTLGSMTVAFCMGILTHHHYTLRNFNDPIIEIPTQPVPVFGRYKTALTYNEFDLIPAINPENQSTSQSGVVTEGVQGQNFVAAKSGTKYYPIGCGTAERIKPENRIYFATEQQAQEKGYSRTATCN
jgi:hypothetical protein